MGKSAFIASMREAIRVRHYSRATEKSYCGWVRQFIRFHGLRHPRGLGAPEVESFLTWLAVERKVSASTQSFDRWVAKCRCRRSILRSSVA